MSKHVAFDDGEHAPKRVRIDVDDGNCQLSPLADPAAWEILEQYLTTDMTYPQMEQVFSAYLGNQYVADDWNDARDALFSGDDDNSIALANLHALKTSHIPLPSSSSRTGSLLSRTSVQQLRRCSQLVAQSLVFNDRVDVPNPYIITEADEDDEEEEDDDEERGSDGVSEQSLKVVRNFGPSAKDRLAATFNNIFDRVEGTAPSLSELCQARHCIAVPSSRVIGGRMYCLHVNSTFSKLILAQHISHDMPGSSTDYIAEHLCHQGFHVTVSIWTAGQLYVVADSPRTITASLPTSHTFAVKQYVLIPDEEREAVDNSCTKLPNPARSDMDVPLEDVERVFCVGDEVRVVAGSYMGLEGHIVQISDDMFHVCQDVSKEEVLISRYYVDRRPLHHMLQTWLPSLQHLEPLPEAESIQIGDHIEVLAGPHFKKCGIVEWIAMKGTMLWFWDTNPLLVGDDVEPSVGPSRICVPVTIVQRTKLPTTIIFTKERGYDVKAGDMVSVAHRPEYQRRGVVQSVDFPNACLTLLSDGDHTLVEVPITFVTKRRNVNLDSFNKFIRQEVFIVGGDLKGYRATLAPDTCTIAVHGQARTTVRCRDVVTSYGMRLNGVILEGLEMISFCEIRRRSYTTTTAPQRSVTPPPERIPSTLPANNLSWASWSFNPEDIADRPPLHVTPHTSEYNPWVVNPEDTQDEIDTGAEKLSDNVSLPWLMGKEYSSMFLLHHVVLKVSVRFMGGRLHK
ncbi:uncharacterized protein EDB93DRAFT_1249538 [Suillus bovinus]|uniref:uncharacterized protein n=1 Tax=Suillus bovinus TaxID=48563 RepID=UPI001B8634CE|nr:uncharacterized protein EDB93DRAFT_1249538 [Suillus bovinus]KAG2151042.1 hypothetical protein EDB93DRAFT_1249538 [Suillus bovinus]